jgi:hypothetical protein
MITKPSYLCNQHDLERHNIVVTLEPTYQRMYSGELDVTLYSGILAGTRHIWILLYGGNSNKMLSR